MKTNSARKWVELAQFPFKSHSNLVIINETEFIAAPYSLSSGSGQKSDGLYKYNTNTNKWCLYLKYPNKLKLASESICIDYTTNKLYIYNKQHQSVVICDLNKKQTKEYRQDTVIGTGSASICIDGEYHVIYGSQSNQHLIWNMHFTYNAVGTWEKKRSHIGHGLVHIKSKNALLLFGGVETKWGRSKYGDECDSIWYYDIPTSEWSELKQKLPYKCSHFGYVITNGEKYIILFGAAGYNIDILDLDTMKFHKSSNKMPLKLHDNPCHAIITGNNEIHLIERKGGCHYKIKLKDVIGSIFEDKRCIPIQHAMDQQSTINGLEQQIYTMMQQINISQQTEQEMEQKCKKMESRLIGHKSMIQKMEQELLNKSQQIQKLENSEKKIKILNKKLLDEKEEMEEECRRHRKLINYQSWNVNDVYNFIMNVDNCRYNKYSNILHTNLRNENINGECLEMMNESDLHRIGITDFMDKKLLKKSIDGLIKNNKRKEDELPICSICYNDTMNYVIEPCHHLYCKECAVKFEQCPKCRAVIKSSFQVYN